MENKKIVGGIRKDDTTWFATFVPSQDMPPQELTTAVVAVAFHGDKILTVKTDKRGWDIPGGHVEEGEILEQALDREVDEEANIKLHEVTHVGYIESDYDQNKITYMAVFLGEVVEVTPFKGKFETSERKFMSLDEFKMNYNGGNPKLMETILEVAIKVRRERQRDFYGR